MTAWPDLLPWLGWGGLLLVLVYWAWFAPPPARPESWPGSGMAPWSAEGLSPDEQQDPWLVIVIDRDTGQPYSVRKIRGECVPTYVQKPHGTLPVEWYRLTYVRGKSLFYFYERRS